VAAYSTDSPPSKSGRDKNADATQIAMETTVEPNTSDVLDQADDIEMEEVNVPQLQGRAENGVPISMRELADAARQRAINGSVEELPSSTIHGLTSTVDTMFRVTSTNTAASSSRSTPPARTVSKRRGSARKRARDESERPELHAKRGKEDGTPVPTPTRVLRPRASKSAAQIQEEKEMEHAYRRAIAD
jgi:xeroderma pigmentosum group C-complementing protein